MRVVFPQLDYITSAGTKMVVFPNEEQWARLFEAAKGLPGATVVDAHGDRRDLWMLSSVASMRPSGRPSAAARFTAIEADLRGRRPRLSHAAGSRRRQAS